MLGSAELRVKLDVMCCGLHAGGLDGLGILGSTGGKAGGGCKSSDEMVEILVEALAVVGFSC